MGTNQVNLLICLVLEKKYGSKWDFNIERGAYASINKYKTWLVSKCYTQKKGVKSKESFFPFGEVCLYKANLDQVAYLGLDFIKLMLRLLISIEN